MTTPEPLTFTDLRRLLFWVEAVRKAVETGDPYTALSEVYRGDEHIVAEYDEDGLIRPSFVQQEYVRNLNALASLAGPRPTEQEQQS